MISKSASDQTDALLASLGFGRCLFLADRQFLVLDPVDQRKENVGPQAHCKYVDRCVNVPTKPFGKLLEHDDRRITRSNKEHIHAFSQAELDEAVKDEGDAA